MSDARFPVKMAGRVPVVETPEEIDITNAGQFREALLACTARGAAIIVVDMSRTHFCDSAGLHALVAAHKRGAGGRRRGAAADHRSWSPARLRDLRSRRVLPSHSDLDRAIGRLGPHQPSVTRCA